MASTLAKFDQAGGNDMWRTIIALWTLLATGWLASPVTAQDVQDLPAIPDPVPVTVDHTTTAYLVLDIQMSTCNETRPACLESLPAIASLLERARAAGLYVVYAGNPGTIRPEVAPLPDEPLVTSSANKFYGTNLHDLLQERGITTLIIVGAAANGAVLYTTFEASVRGYTVAVAEDGISSTQPFQTFLTRYQLLNQPGFSNPTNQPLLPRAPTLTRTDLITME
jgi:nicotinamidase-related amidase